MCKVPLIKFDRLTNSTEFVTNDQTNIIVRVDDSIAYVIEQTREGNRRVYIQNRIWNIRGLFICSNKLFQSTRYMTVQNVECLFV